LWFALLSPFPVPCSVCFTQSVADLTLCALCFLTHAGEALWEPSALGYTKSDGLLVLANGEIIEDPAKVAQVSNRCGVVREGAVVLVLVQNRARVCSARQLFVDKAKSCHL
jgi:hypothetical protein